MSTYIPNDIRLYTTTIEPKEAVRYIGDTYELINLNKQSMFGYVGTYLLTPKQPKSFSIEHNDAWTCCGGRFSPFCNYHPYNGVVWNQGVNIWMEPPPNNIIIHESFEAVQEIQLPTTSLWMRYTTDISKTVKVRMNPSEYLSYKDADRDIPTWTQPNDREQCLRHHLMYFHHMATALMLEKDDSRCAAYRTLFTEQFKKDEYILLLINNTQYDLFKQICEKFKWKDDVVVHDSGPYWNLNYLPPEYQARLHFIALHINDAFINSVQSV